MLAEMVVEMRRCRPMVHCITNYVTANDCANLLLACGASPIMADDPQEAAEVTVMCDGLVLNLGTPDPGRLKAMRLAGRKANRFGHPVVLDPVGVGCSAMRREAACRLLREVRIDVIRGNASEIATLVCGTAAHRGVDVDSKLDEAAERVRWRAEALAQKTGAVVIVTGETDLVTDGRRTYRVRNGHGMMRSVTGAGCQLSALVGAYMAANPNEPMRAALAAVCAMGLCGEIAYKRLAPQDGNASYRAYIIDAMYHLSPDMLEEGARYGLE